MNTLLKLREKYTPSNIKVIFILESPPQGHGFVYDPSGHTGEVLFRAFMRIMNVKPETKEIGLQQLKQKGIFLMNPTYTPVNKLKDSEADKIIMDNYENFIADLTLHNPEKEIPLILVKSNICRLLEEPLTKDGFSVLNKGQMIPFPIHYHQDKFHEIVSGLATEII